MSLAKYSPDVQHWIVTINKVKLSGKKKLSDPYLAYCCKKMHNPTLLIAFVLLAVFGFQPSALQATDDAIQRHLDPVGAHYFTTHHTEQGEVGEERVPRRRVRGEFRRVDEEDREEEPIRADREIESTEQAAVSPRLEEADEAPETMKRRVVTMRPEQDEEEKPLRRMERVRRVRRRLELLDQEPEHEQQPEQLAGLSVRCPATNVTAPPTNVTAPPTPSCPSPATPACPQIPPATQCPQCPQTCPSPPVVPCPSCPVCPQHYTSVPPFHSWPAYRMILQQRAARQRPQTLWTTPTGRMPSTLQLPITSSPQAAGSWRGY